MAMSNAEILDLFKKAASEVLEESFDKITYESRIAEFGIDSLSIAEIVAKIEDTLEIRISDETLMEIRTVQELIDAVVEAQEQG